MATQTRKASRHQARRAQAWVHHAAGTDPSEKFKVECAQDRLHLITSNLHHFISLAKEATASGSELANLVFVLFDADDPLGEKIARAAIRVSGEDLSHDLNAIRQRGEIPTFITALSRKDMAQALRRTNPEVSERLQRRPPEGNALCAGVASGGVALTLMLFPWEVT